MFCNLSGSFKMWVSSRNVAGEFLQGRGGEPRIADDRGGNAKFEYMDCL